MKILRFGVALLAAGRLLASYQFYYTDNLTSINPATWTQNGNPSPQGYGATLISTVASPTGNDYDIRMTVPQAGCAAYATLYARSTPNAATSYSVQFAISGITLSKNLPGSSTTLSYLPAYCTAGMVVRMVVQGNNIIVHYGPYTTTYQDPNPITTGQPGLFLQSIGAITNVEIGPIDYVPPPPINASSVLSPAAPGWVDLSWPAGSDDPNGTGLAGYYVYRVDPNLGNVYLGSPATPAWLDETVTAGTGVTYLLYAYSQQGMVSTAATVNVAVPPTSQPDQRRIGVRPTGAYWGAAGEQIDLLSGNVNFSLPLLTAMGRGNWSVTFSLSNNSQIWRQDASGVRLLGEDLGVGLGWKLQAGSIRPVWYGGAIQHVVYSDSTGAEYILDQDNNGVWTSLQGIHVFYDSNANVLHFTDGSFWQMGAQSGATEQDAGTLYPTVMEDSNGNQINIRYNVAVGSYSPSSRIAWIQDARVGYMTAYNFTYNSDPIPHLTRISNNVGTSESYTLTTWGEAVVDPFTGTPFGSPALLAQVTVNGLNVSTQFTYWYGTGELTGVITPLGGQLAWGYRAYNYASTNRTYREVDERLMSAAIPNGYQSWSINLDSSPTWHATATVVDNGANTQKTWNFSTLTDYTAGLAVAYQEKDTTGTLLEKDYTWAQNPAGAPYVGTLVTKLNPNASYAAQTQTVQTQDQYGNLLSSTVSDYAGSTTGTRRYVYSYLGQYSPYAPLYILNRLTYAAVYPAGSGTSITLAQNSYDGATYAPYCGYMIDTSAATEHDPAYNTSFTARGNLAETFGLNSSDPVCTAYDTAGVPYYTANATGSVSVQTNPDSNYSLPGVITPNGTSSLASSATYASSWGVTSMTGPNGAQGTTTFDAYGRPSQTTIPDGATTTYTYTNYVAQPYAAATQTTTVDGRWKTTTVDGFGRTTRVQTGNGSTIVSTVDTQYAPCACSPLGKMSAVSQPYGPGATPVWTTYTYDGSGRTLTVTAPDGSVARYAYQGNSTTVTDPAGKWKTATVDAYGNVILVTEPNPAGGANLTTNYTYTPANQLATVSMTRGGVAQTRTFVYNGWDMVSATNPENGTVTYTYDNAHHVTNRTDALGQQTQYTYDSYGRLTEVQYFLLDMWHNLNEDTTQRVTYSYDNANQFTQNGLGRLSQVTFGGGVADDFNDSYYYLYSYNTAGRVTSQQMAVQTLVNGLHGPQLNTWITFTANYQWDNEGRMTSLQYPTVSLPNNPPWETSFTLQTAAYQYDVNGRMTGMTWDSGNGPQPYASATYGPAGQMLTLSYGAGTETRQYNSLLQLTSQSVPGYLNMTYNYSAGQNNGRIVGSVDGITGENTTYTYDALNRLSSATASGMWSEQYSYDGFGNLTGKSQTGGAPSMGANYNAQNQQVGGGAAYDANGNQTTANNTTNVFTVENRIKSQASTAWPYPQLAEYAYDPWGRRVMTQTDADPNNPDSTASWQFNFYGITGQRLVTLGCTNPSANPLPNCTVQGQNVYFGRKLLVSNGVTVVTDRLGSVRANTQGEKFAYYPYGEERTVTVDSREKFGTYFRDGVGQDYAMARYYGAGTGRFWSPDPGGIKTADPGTPPSWNRYGYVNGDPVNHTDRHGLLVDVFDCDSDSCWEGEDASDYWDGWGIEPMPEQPVPTATANERRKRQLAIIAAYNAIAGAIANLAAQANKVATWPLYIQEVSMCSKSSLSGIELDVTYQVYNDLGQPMTSNLDGFSITEQFLDQIGNMSNLNQTAGTWTRSNNTLFTNGQFIDVLTTGGLAGTQSATALQEFTATGWFGVQPLGISVGGADVNGVNYNTYSSTNVTVDGKGATGPCSGN